MWWWHQVTNITITGGWGSTFHNYWWRREHISQSPPQLWCCLGSFLATPAIITPRHLWWDIYLTMGWMGNDRHHKYSDKVTIRNYIMHIISFFVYAHNFISLHLIATPAKGVVFLISVAEKTVMRMLLFIYKKNCNRTWIHFFLMISSAKTYSSILHYMIFFFFKLAFCEDVHGFKILGCEMFTNRKVNASEPQKNLSYG